MQFKQSVRDMYLSMKREAGFIGFLKGKGDDEDQKRIEP